jgi:hypothetical protein
MRVSHNSAFRGTSPIEEINDRKPGGRGATSGHPRALVDRKTQLGTGARGKLCTMQNQRQTECSRKKIQQYFRSRNGQPQHFAHSDFEVSAFVSSPRNLQI